MSELLNNWSTDVRLTREGYGELGRGDTSSHLQRLQAKIIFNISGAWHSPNTASIMVHDHSSRIIM